MTLEELPPVLVLHLKRFVFEKTGGCQKLIKNIDYPVDLEISKGAYSIFFSPLKRSAFNMLFLKRFSPGTQSVLDRGISVAFVLYQLTSGEKFLFSTHCILL